MSTTPAPRESALLVRGARLAWREWGPNDGAPVLALHGWLDNAASFDALAPQLTGCRVIALDLPGHGLSAHRGPEGSYNIWDDLPDLVAFVRELGLARYRVLGHSRGAFIGALLAAIEPESVSSLALLDGILPPPFDAAKTVEQLRRYAHDYGRRAPRKARVFATAEQAIEARCLATGIDPRAAAQLMERSLVRVDGGLRWGTDARLRYASALKLGEANLRTVLGSLALPVLLVSASEGLARRPELATVRGWVARLEHEEVPGGHHCHMLEQAGAIAARLQQFWRERDPSQAH